MKVLILCGGKGLRMKEYSETSPKPMALVDNKPLLWHIMKIFSFYGYNDFILLLGYKSEVIKEYFMDYDWKQHSFILDNTKGDTQIQLLENKEPWRITFLETGEDTMTGGRVKQAEAYIGDEDCFLTYGDGIAEIDINMLYAFHKRKGKLATVTGIHRSSQFGFINVDDNLALSFTEKPILDGIINGGFFVLSRKAFDYVDDNKDCIFEDKPLKRLAAERQLAVYRHDGYWEAADTIKDLEEIEKHIKRKRPFWYGKNEHLMLEGKE